MTELTDEERAQLSERELDVLHRIEDMPELHRLRTETVTGEALRALAHTRLALRRAEAGYQLSQAHHESALKHNAGLVDECDALRAELHALRDILQPGEGETLCGAAQRLRVERDTERAARTPEGTKS